MRSKLVGSLAALFFVSVLAVAVAQSDTTARDFTIQGRTQKSFKDERVFLVNVETLVPESMGPEAARAGIQIGHLLYIHVGEDAQVIDDEGRTLKREGKDDAGWKEINDEGNRLQITLGGEKREMKLNSKDIKGTVDCYEARRLQVLKKH